MLYGVIARKSGRVQVELVEPVSRSGYDRARERFRSKGPASWRPGHVTLTPGRVTYVPSAGATGAQSVTMNLRDIRTVEVDSGPLARMVSFRTDTRVLHLRATGAHAFAKRVAIACRSVDRQLS